jgi:charged multivesicular body protein 7
LPNVTLSLPDIKVLVKYLERDRRVLVTFNEVIKFPHGFQENPVVTQVDHGILELKLAINKLDSQIEHIQRQIEEYVCFPPVLYRFSLAFGG